MKNSPRLGDQNLYIPSHLTKKLTYRSYEKVTTKLQQARIKLQ